MVTSVPSSVPFWNPLFLFLFSFEDVFRWEVRGGRDCRGSNSDSSPSFAIFLSPVTLKSQIPNRTQHWHGCRLEILWRNCLLWILTRKPKDSLTLLRKMNNINGLLPWKKKSNYMCIDFFKGWYWIPRNILESYLPSIGKLKGNDILRQKANFEMQGTVTIINTGMWWTCTMKYWQHPHPQKPPHTHPLLSCSLQIIFLVFIVGLM